jgi:hypothetical protein
MGTFYVYDEQGNLLGSTPNKFVNSGKQFMLDFAFNSTSWLSGNWYGQRYLAVGGSTNTNGGVIGPTTGTGIPVNDENWHGASENDWRLTSEYTGTYGRAQFTCQRTNNVCLLSAQITDDNVNHSAYGANIQIVELGLFLTSGYNLPAADPTDALNTTSRKNAMIARAVKTTISGTDYLASPYIKTQGNVLNVKYIFNDFEG